MHEDRHPAGRLAVFYGVPNRPPEAARALSLNRLDGRELAAAVFLELNLAVDEGE